MEFIKLTLKQVKDLEQALDDWDYDKSVLIRMHYEKKVNGHNWIAYPELNYLTYSELEKALYEGYEIKGVEEKTYSLEDLKKGYYEALNKDNKESSMQELEADLDYHLLSLKEALKDSDKEQVEYLKKELSKIVEKLEALD